MTKIICTSLARKIVFNSMCFLILFLFAVIRMADGAEVVERIVAVVNNDIIVLTEFNKELRPGIANIKSKGLPKGEEEEELSKYRMFLLNQLINQKLIDQEIKKYSISISEEEVDSYMETIRQSKNLTKEQLEKEIKENLGLTMVEYREKVRGQLLRMRLVNSQVQSKVVVTDEDRQSFYDHYGKEFAPGNRYHLRNIMMKVPAEAEESERQDVLNKMEGVLTELKEGASFAEMADKYSETSSPGDGGDLGSFNFADLSMELQNALKDIQEGAFTSVVSTDMGYQVLYVEKIEVDSGKTLEEASPDIDKQIYNASVNMKFQSWVMELRNRSHIKILEE